MIQFLKNYKKKLQFIRIYFKYFFFIYKNFFLFIKTKKYFIIKNKYKKNDSDIKKKIIRNVFKYKKIKSLNMKYVSKKSVNLLNFNIFILQKFHFYKLKKVENHVFLIDLFLMNSYII